MGLPENILTKDEFVAVVAELRAADDLSRALASSLRQGAGAAGNEAASGMIDPYALFSGHLSTLVIALERMFLDADGWLSWWLFECDYGRDGKIRSAFRSDGRTPIDLSTPPGALYEFLVEGLTQGDHMR